MNPLTHFKKILILPLLIPLALVAAVPLTSRTGDADSNRRQVVNCDRGQNIAEVLARAEPGDTIRVTGTCVERVSIKTDRITLDGQGAATLDGGGGPTSEFLWFISIPPNPSAITGNGVDVDLRFGARATFDGVDVGTITCDSTVLSRGTTVCP